MTGGFGDGGSMVEDLDYSSDALGDLSGVEVMIRSQDVPESRL